MAELGTLRCRPAVPDDAADLELLQYRSALWLTARGLPAFSAWPLPAFIRTSLAEPD